MNNEAAPKPANGLLDDLHSCWRALPNKTFFFVLLAAWLALFQFFGNATMGYVHSSSLFHWMYNAYTAASTISDDSHGKLIPFAVLGIMWWKRKQLFAQPLQIWAPAIFVVAAALLVHLVGFMIQQTRVSVIALYLGIYGLMGLAWGLAWLRASFFPWFLFAFAVPLGSATETVTFPLRLMVSNLVALICHNLLGINIVCQGTVLSKPPMQYQYEVAAACSGMRSLIAITAVAIIYGFMVFPDWRKRLVLIASALPLAVIGNTFRLMAIVITAEFDGQEAGNRVHDSAFWSMLPYIPAIIGLLLIGRWLERIHAKNERPPTGTVESLITP